MANNVQTAEEWKKVAAEDQAKLDKYLAEQATVVSEFERLSAARAEAKSRLDQSVAATGSLLSPESTAIRAEYNKLNGQVNQARTQVNQYTQLVDSYKNNVVYANTQAEKAQSGPPNTNSTPQPAGASTNANSEGSNTGVIVTPVPEPTAYSAFTTEFDPDPAPFAREIGAGAEPESPDDDPNVRALMESTRQQAEDEFEFGDAPTEADLIDPSTEPLTTPDGTIEGEGDAGTGLEEPPYPEDDGAAEGGNTAATANANAADAAANEVKRREPLPSQAKDWRVGISLAKTANYLYRADNAGILSPLKSTEGVIFPYMPTIQVGYSAKYDSQLPTHSNYMIHNYQGSSVESLTITGEFTAQSVPEANYLLAVIHFFKSATKMFYGKDDPNRGVPPPLLYLSGLGQYQFDNHPMVLTNFTYSLPVDVDYVDAYSLDSGSPSKAVNGVSLEKFVQPQRNIRPTNIFDGVSRLLSGSTKIQAGGRQPQNSFKKSPDSVKSITRVPSKISISLTLHPMITRKSIVESFNLQDYATGKLLRGSERSGGGIW